jgi:iron complex outermembrane receptor protein
LIPDYKKYDFGIYAVSDYQLDSNWLFEVGARFDFTYMDVYKFYRTSFWELRNYNENFSNLIVEELVNQVLARPQLNYYNGSTTLGATYDFVEDYKLFLNYTIASRTPNPSELFSEGLHHSAARIEYGNLEFNSEVGHKLSLTLERINEKFSFSLNPFINTVSDFIIIEPVGINNSIRGTFPVWEYRQTNVQLLGMDFNASYVFSEELRFNHLSSMVKGYDRLQDEPLINIPAVNTKNELVYFNPKIKNLRLALQSEYVFRQNEYPDTNFEIYIPQTETRELVDVSSPPNAYHLLNFNSSIDFDFSEKSSLSLGFGITNLFNTSYRNYLNRLRFYANDLGRNLLLNIKFNY